MSATVRNITRGSVWVRKADGQETTVLGTPDPHSVTAYVAHQAKRTTYTQVPNFLRKYVPKPLTVLAEGCTCGECGPGCETRMFFPCCGACMEHPATVEADA